eukprot:RCo047211
MKRVLKLSQPTLTKTAAKVLKDVLRFLGRKWRAANMSLVSAVYTAVRHDLGDVRAYAESPVEPVSPLSYRPRPSGYTTDIDSARKVYAFNRKWYPSGQLQQLSGSFESSEQPSVVTDD